MCTNSLTDEHVPCDEKPCEFQRQNKTKIKILTMYYVPRLIDFRIQPKEPVGSKDSNKPPLVIPHRTKLFSR
jgi:hypothetical protein